MKKYLNILYYSLGAVFISFLMIFLNGGFTHWKQGLDLSGGVRLLYKMDFSQYRKNYSDAEFNSKRNDVIDIVTRNIDSRISKLGVSDYNSRYVSLGGKDYIEIELGGINDIESAKKKIGKTVQMTFKVPFEGELTPKIKASRQVFAEKLLEMIKNNDEKVGVYLDPIGWNVFPQQVSLSKDEIKKVFGEDITPFLTGDYTYPKLLNGENMGEKSFDIYKFIGKKDDKYNFLKVSVLEKPRWQDAKEDGNLLNGERFKMATVGQNKGGEITVNIYFDEKGKQIFCSLTRKYLHKPMAIFIGNKLITYPTIQEEVCGGVAQITGKYTKETAQKLKDELNNGAMPVPLKLEQEEKVSPTLGEKALQNAIIAAGVGVVIIFVLFAIFYDFVYAVITLISLGIFFIVLMGFIKVFGIVLSLSAIGAILLNIGMAVDANVIIFERIKEELESGSSITTAIEKGYEYSISAIRDGNVTTGLIALLLFFQGTNIFKGFGTMMIINIIIVLFVMVPAIPGLVALFKARK